jgi:hypothetical protein
MTTENTSPVFDYRALRLLMGIIAFALPFTVSLISTDPLPSISASYYTEARDTFVGMLFIVASFLWAYKGHTSTQARASKVASLAAVFVVVFPTTCAGCKADLRSGLHYVAAATLFAILSYFCFGPFREKTKDRGGKKGRRSKIYFTCGCVMLACMLAMGVAKITVPDETVKALKITYWAEAIALGAFGVAWIVAGKVIPPLVDEEDALKLQL